MQYNSENVVQINGPDEIANETQESETTKNVFWRAIDWVTWFFTSQPFIHILLLFNQSLYGGFGVIGPMALATIHPMVFAFGRIFLIGSTVTVLALIFDINWYKKGMEKDDDRSCAWPFSLFKIPSWQDGVLLFTLGALMAYGVFSYVMAVKLAPYTIVAILQPTMTAFACFFSVLLRREGFSIFKVAGVLLAVFGSISTLLIITFLDKNGDKKESGDGTTKMEKVIGSLLELSNSVIIALYLVTQKTLLNRGVPPFTCVAWTFTISMALGLIVSAYFFQEIVISAIPAIGWIGLLYGGLVIGTLGFSISSFAAKYSTPTIVAVYNTTAPIYSVVFLYIFKGQTTTWWALPGAVAISAGVILVGYGKHRENQAEQRAKLAEEEQNSYESMNNEQEGLLRRPIGYSSILNRQVE